MCLLSRVGDIPLVIMTKISDPTLLKPMQSCIDDPLPNTSNNETFIPNFLEILKLEILKKIFIGTIVMSLTYVLETLKIIFIRTIRIYTYIRIYVYSYIRIYSLELYV